MSNFEHHCHQPDSTCRGRLVTAHPASGFTSGVTWRILRDGKATRVAHTAIDAEYHFWDAPAVLGSHIPPLMHWCVQWSEDATAGLPSLIGLGTQPHDVRSNKVHPVTLNMASFKSQLFDVHWRSPPALKMNDKALGYCARFRIQCNQYQEELNTKIWLPRPVCRVLH